MEVDRQGLMWLEHEAPNPFELAQAIRHAMNHPSPFCLHSHIVWQLLFEQDAEGLTSAQRWKRTGFPGLKNDSRVLMHAKMGLHVALLEIQRVLDHECTEVIDLLDDRPVRFVVRDRGLARTANRFATGLTWVYTLPHYRRLHGGAVMLEDIPHLDPREVVDEFVRHLGGPLDPIGVRLWLAKNFVRVETALNAVRIERHRLAALGVDRTHGQAVYELRVPFGVVRDQLDTLTELAEAELTDQERRAGFAEARVWFGDENDLKEFQADAAARLVMGRILLGQMHWRLETSGATRLARLRQIFETHLGARIKFTGDRIDDFLEHAKGEVPAGDPALLPPRLLENPQARQLTALGRPVNRHDTRAEFPGDPRVLNQKQTFLDAALPELDGQTPREAAVNPMLRAKLIRLMKAQVRACDELNLATGQQVDINWMLRELALDEINFEPPPANRKPPAITTPSAEDITDFERELINDAVALDMDPTLPLAPRLPPRPFTLEEILQRLRAGMEPYELAADALDALESAGCTLIEMTDDQTAGLVDDHSFSLLIPLLVQIWLVFVPPGTRGPNLSAPTLRSAIEHEMHEFLQVLQRKNQGAFDRYLEHSPQRALAEVMVDLIQRGVDGLPQRQKPSPEKQGIMGAVLLAVIAELDRAHRQL